MPLGLFNVGWLSQNSQRAYPFFEDASRLDITESVQVPDNFLVELYFPVPSTVSIDPALFYVQSLAIFGAGYQIGIAYFDDDENPIVANAVIPKSGFTENKSFPLIGIDDYEESSGKIVIGLLDGIEQLPAGVYEFDYDAGRLDPDCIRPELRDLISLSVINGSEESPKFYDRIALSAGTNFKLSYSTEDDITTIRFDAIDGEGLNADCDCLDDGIGPPIRTLNGVRPDASGNIDLLGDACVSITPGTHELFFKDLCSKPCCDCTELGVVTDAASRFADEFETWRNFVNRLEAAVTEMELTVLGSRLNDSGCQTCEEIVNDSDVEVSDTGITIRPGVVVVDVSVTDPTWHEGTLGDDPPPP